MKETKIVKKEFLQSAELWLMNKNLVIIIPVRLGSRRLKTKIFCQ